MSLLTKLFTALRGGATEIGQAIVDTQDIRILEQEVRDGEAKLAKARADLATLMGKESVSRGKLEQMKVKYEQDVAILERLVAENREPGLQEELAGRIATLETAIQDEANTFTEYGRTRAMLESTIKALSDKIAQVKRDVDKVKVTASVQSAQKAIMAQGQGIASSVGGAAATLQRIKEKQEGLAAQFQAQQQIEDATSGKDLDRRLAAAGVTSGPGTAASVLARARQKAALPAPGATAALPLPTGSSTPEGTS